MVRNPASVLPSDTRERHLFFVNSRRLHLEKRLIDGLLPIQPRFQVNKPSNRWYIARIFQIWSTPVGYEELAGGFKANQDDGKIF